MSQETNQPDANKGKKKKRFSRRKFLKRSGILLGGTAAVLYLGRTPIRRYISHYVSEMDLPSGVFNFEPDFWFEVLADNTILLKSPKAEMGQGIFTGFAMIAAEELEVPLEQIKVVPGSTSTGPVDYAGTGGSSTTAALFIPIREVAATMREMLRNAAANHWGVAASTIQNNQGVFSQGGQSMTYAEVTNVTEKWEVPDTPKLKPSSEFKYVGTEQKRTDLAPKVMGEAIFAIDEELEDMLYAVILKCPYLEGKLKSLDAKEARQHPGVVQVIEEEDLIAVVAKNRYAAEMGKRKLKAEWEVTKNWQQVEVEDLVTVGNGNKVNLQKDGSARSILSDEKNEIIQAEYRTPIGVHAQMEPNGAIAKVDKDGALMIIGTQAPSNVRMKVAGELGLKESKVDIKNTFLGGGFGRRYWKEEEIEAARIAKIMGQAVSLFNDRENEFQNGFFRPLTHHVLKAKLQSDGSLEAIQHEMASADMILHTLPMPGAKTLLGADFISIGHGAKFIYDVPNRDASMWDVEVPFPPGIWRGVGMFPNTFAIESFLDELAVKAGKNPFEFRLQHLNDPHPVVQRMRKVLEVAQERSGWNATKPDGIGRGFACGEDRKSLAAAVVEVQMVEGRIRVTKVTQVVDPGVIINPEGVRTQVEGCVMMGISATLYEGTYIKDGQFTATNYHQYPMAMMWDVPEIEVVMLEGSEKPYGVGEPPIAPMAPAIANAIFDLTGKRLRTLPLSLENS